MYLTTSKLLFFITHANEDHDRTTSEPEYLRGFHAMIA